MVQVIYIPAPEKKPAQKEIVVVHHHHYHSKSSSSSSQSKSNGASLQRFTEAMYARNASNASKGVAHRKKK